MPVTNVQLRRNSRSGHAPGAHQVPEFALPGFSYRLWLVDDAAPDLDAANHEAGHGQKHDASSPCEYKQPLITGSALTNLQLAHPSCGSQASLEFPD